MWEGTPGRCSFRVEEFSFVVLDSVSLEYSRYVDQKYKARAGKMNSAVEEI